MEQECVVLISEAAGGVARHVVDLFFGLRRRGWPVKLVISPRRLEEMYSEKLKPFASDDVLFLPMHREPHLSDLTVRDVLKQRLGKLGRRVILHCHSTKAGMLGATLGSHSAARVYTPHAFRSVDPSLAPLCRAAIQQIERAFCLRFDRLIAVAPAEFHHALKLGAAPEKVRYVPNGISPVLSNPVRYRFPAESSRPPSVGFVGRLVRQKNPGLFLEVVRRVADVYPDVCARVVGDGPLRPALQRQAERLGLAGNVEWHGTVPADAAFAQMDVYVHTSLYEGMPYALIEAAAYQTPIVATRNDGSVAVLGDRWGAAAHRSFQASVLADEVLTLLSDRVALHAHLADLQERSAQFTAENMISGVETVYEELFARPEGRPVPRALPLARAS